MTFVSAIRLRDMMLNTIHSVAPTCIAIELHHLPGPYCWNNWRIGRLDVGVEDFGAARDMADTLESEPQWIMVPDGHPLDGQICGKERGPP